MVQKIFCILYKKIQMPNTSELYLFVVNACTILFLHKIIIIKLIYIVLCQCKFHNGKIIQKNINK